MDELTAEELVDRLCDTSGIEYCRLVCRLYEAAIEKGRAEGAEQMKAEIRKTADGWVSILPLEHLWFYNESNDKLRIVPASILVPEDAERDEPPDPMEEIADKYF